MEIKKILPSEQMQTLEAYKSKLSDYDHIILTEEETNQALLDAKIKKEMRLERLATEERINANRRAICAFQWTPESVKSYLTQRAEELNRETFKKPFLIENVDQKVLEMICYYLANHSKFERMGEGFSLKKGLCFVGVPGCGKSYLMQLINKNPIQSFYIKTSDEIARAFIASENKGNDVIEFYSENREAPINDSTIFFQKQIGYCFRDLGTEETKNNFGNKSNVMSEILLRRYDMKNFGHTLHVETNLTADQIEKFYGARVRSRFKEMFNWIKFEGIDRRK